METDNVPVLYVTHGVQLSFKSTVCVFVSLVQSLYSERSLIVYGQPVDCAEASGSYYVLV